MLIDGDLNTDFNKISSYNSYILQILIGGQPVPLCLQDSYSQHP